MKFFSLSSIISPNFRALLQTEFKFYAFAHLAPDQLVQQVAPFARTWTTTTDRQTSLLAGSDRHVLGVLREAYPRVRCHRTLRPRGTVARRTVVGSGTLWRTRRKSPWGRRRWAHNLWGGRSRQESPYPFRRSAQARYDPQGSGSSAGGSARDKGWMGRWGSRREWRTQSRRRTAHFMHGWDHMRNTLEQCGAMWIMTTRTWLTNKRTAHSRVSVHVRCVESVLGLGGHVVIGVTLSLVSCSVSPRRRNTKYRFLSFWIL